jgi:hypothetical protein
MQSCPSPFCVFGDSLSDTGNSFAVTTELTGGLFSIPPSPPYSNGRASNGALALEILADRFQFSNLLSQGIDSIKDYQSGLDKIIISALGFGGGLQAGIALIAEQFLETTSSTATTGEQRY